VVGTDVSVLVVSLSSCLFVGLLHTRALSHTHSHTRHPHTLTHSHTPQDGLDTADKCEILAFATVMLNTDRYNPAIKQKKKMTNTQFKKNMRGMGVSNDFLDIVRPRLTSTKY
jgi:hypothetical protein